MKVGIPGDIACVISVSSHHSSPFVVVIPRTKFTASSISHLIHDLSDPSVVPVDVSHVDLPTVTYAGAPLESSSTPSVFASSRRP